jgi:hypothetical protein
VDKDLTDIVKWAKSQRWRVTTDSKGYSRFYDPVGNYITYYPATPRNARRRMADLCAALKRAGLADASAEQERAARAAQEGQPLMNDQQQPEEWAVTFTFAAASDEDRLDKLACALGEHDASVAGAPPDRVTVAMHVAAVGPVEAIARAHAVVAAVVTMVLGVAPVLAVEALTEAEHERRADAPTLPELVGASEVAGMLGVSRQRVHQLREHPSFPAPLVEVAMGPLWDARAVLAFAAEWDRRPGRPRLQVAQ